MKAQELKRDLLKDNWLNNFHLIIHTDDKNWYHCHDDEEVPVNSDISLRAQLPLPIDTLNQEEIVE